MEKSSCIYDGEGGGKNELESKMTNYYTFCRREADDIRKRLEAEGYRLFKQKRATHKYTTEEVSLFSDYEGREACVRLSNSIIAHKMITGNSEEMLTITHYLEKNGYQVYRRTTKWNNGAPYPVIYMRHIATGNRVSVW